MSLVSQKFCLRSEFTEQKLEKYTGAEPNTMKMLVINNRHPISESQEVKMTESDFESGQESTILVRERTRGSKLQGAFQKRKGILQEQYDYTIQF